MTSGRMLPAALLLSGLPVGLPMATSAQDNNYADDGVVVFGRCLGVERCDHPGLPEEPS